MLQNPSLWSSITSCFTPVVLFLLLNLTIAAIVFVSSLSGNHHHHHHDHPLHDHVKIFRSPSILQRLKSINIYALIPDQPHPKPNIPNSFPHDNFNSHDHSHPEPEQEPEPITDEVGDNNPEEEDESQFQTMDEIYSRLDKEVQFGRTKSDTEPSGLGRAPVPTPARIRKSASMKPKPKPNPEKISAVEARRPATTRERVPAKVTEGEDAGVDAKADDFINKFKRQLHLQRLDSILKYKERIQRGLVGGT